eukprot:NODE_680_length_4796_cov_0.472855.p4 type:complete len:129 gc:universal NODE_680_length_4796_cov_0.472855:2110-1724(-)
MGMFIRKENRKTIYEYLFREGVLVAKKDYNAKKHMQLDVRNLEVIKALQSLDSRGYVRTQFSWQYYYYVLTDEGIEYLREYLHLPEDVSPNTLKASVRAAQAGQAPQSEKREKDDGEFKPEFKGFGKQ